MFFPSDPFSEIVIHFVGYFEIAVEDMRIRHQLQQGEFKDKLLADDPEHVQIAADVRQSYALGSYTPGVHYAPPDWLIRGDAPIQPIDIKLPTPNFYIDLGPLEVAQEMPHTPGSTVMPHVGQEPGAIIAVIYQTITLADDDVMSMATLDEPVVFDSGAASALIEMQQASLDVLGAMAGSMALQSYDDVPRLLDVVGDAIGEHQNAPATQFHAVETLIGTHVNGELVDEAPDFKDALPDNVRELEAPETDPRAVVEESEATAQVEIRGEEVEGSVVFNAGGNYLYNEAVVLNGGLVGAQFVVGGDFHQLDAIIQINVYTDLETVEGGFPLSSDASTGTTAVNVASFIQETRDVGGDAAKANPGVMPQNWQVTVVSGDIVFLEWMKQFTFMSDQDIGVLTATGNHTTITSGENLGINTVSFQNVGLYYDLILVGGDVYDANIVVQTNILYDSDTLALMGEGDVPASAAGGYNTSGNLLWNQATIHNVGATDIQNGIADSYADAMKNLDDGDWRMPASFRNEAGLEGIAMPRVLYVSGNIYDLRYIEQTNILGDADYVALQKSAFLANQPQTEWEIDTGSNALVNIATIRDYDTYGSSIQVGGNHYSDAILIQAEILAGDGADGGPDALVTEVVAFLDTTDDIGDIADMGHIDLPQDGTPVDLMQSVLA